MDITKAIKAYRIYRNADSYEAAIAEIISSRLADNAKDAADLLNDGEDVAVGYAEVGVSIF